MSDTTRERILTIAEELGWYGGLSRPGHASTVLLDSGPQLHRKWVVNKPDADHTDVHGIEHGILDATPALVEVESDHFVASD